MAATAALLLTGCFKKVTRETDYVLKPLSQTLSGATVEPLEGTLAYAFDVDTAEYTVLSYDDAKAGVVARKSAPTEKISTPSATAEPYATEQASGWIHMTLRKTSQMVVAVDTKNRLYGYTQQKTDVNLPNLFVSMVFKPWKEGFSYKDGEWSIYNAYYVPAQYQTCTVTPSVQVTDGGAVESIAAASPAPKVYAFAADTTLWYLASYDDAVNGQITSKNNPAETRTSPIFQGYKETSADRFKIEKINSTPLMVVIVDRVNRRYAYSKQTIDLTGAAPTYAFVFRLWRTEWIYVEDGWRVVNPDKKPKTSAQNKSR